MATLVASRSVRGRRHLQRLPHPCPQASAAGRADARWFRLMLWVCAQGGWLGAEGWQGPARPDGPRRTVPRGPAAGSRFRRCVAPPASYCSLWPARLTGATVLSFGCVWNRTGFDGRRSMFIEVHPTPNINRWVEHAAAHKSNLVAAMSSCRCLAPTAWRPVHMRPVARAQNSPKSISPSPLASTRSESSQTSNKHPL
jgi:hypothetical protein